MAGKRPKAAKRVLERQAGLDAAGMLLDQVAAVVPSTLLQGTAGGPPPIPLHLRPLRPRLRLNLSDSPAPGRIAGVPAERRPLWTEPCRAVALKAQKAPAEEYPDRGWQLQW
jgi:hypothetical protein